MTGMSHRRPAKTYFLLYKIKISTISIYKLSKMHHVNFQGTENIGTYYEDSPHNTSKLAWKVNVDSCSSDSISKFQIIWITLKICSHPVQNEECPKRENLWVFKHDHEKIEIIYIYNVNT
jgi:hypothetical protein